jgi:uncharacterized membrane protein
MERPQRQRIVLLLLGFLYLVGVVCISTGFLKPLVLSLTPVILLLTILTQLFFEGKPYAKTLPAAIGVGILGFTAEVVGVKGGWLFGQYAYGESLGPKLFEVPLIMAINWMLLVHAAVATMRQMFFAPFLAALASAVIITAIDALIEPMAGPLDFWHWENGIIPAQNFLGWLAVGFLLSLAYRYIAKPVERNFSRWVLVMQACFFLGLRLLSL